MIGIETLIKTAKMPPETATELRNITITEIDKMQRTEKRKPSKPNLLRQECQAVNTRCRYGQQNRDKRGRLLWTMDWKLRSVKREQRRS